MSGAQRTDFDAVVIGAGFAGLYMLHSLRRLGLSARVFERGGDVGGTWYWNRYPGARCDAESVLYSYSFDSDLVQNWTWSERFAAQPEILAYIRHVADRFDLRRDIVFNCEIQSAVFDDAAGLWTVEYANGQHVTCRFLITAVGCLSTASMPDIPGLSDFRGQVLHTGGWPHEEVDFSGKRVGVIGTGSSGIQVIPMLAEQAAHLTVFQRTANFSLPARNMPMSEEKTRFARENFADLRNKVRRGDILSGGDTFLSDEERLPAAESALALGPDERVQAYDMRWNIGGACLLKTFPDLLVNLESNRTAADFVKRKIRSIVEDPETAEILSPNDHPFGSKRICVDTNYYATYNRPNVSVVDLKRDPITAITPDGIRTEAIEYPLDSIVFATGFDAITGPLLKLNIRGVGGVSLTDKWANGPSTYLGIGMAGFPNLFTITGPLSPSVFGNVVVSIEQHVEWIADCLTYMANEGFGRIEAEPDAERDWQEHVNAVVSGTLFNSANSWFNGANIPGKPRAFLAYLGGLGPYRDICDQVAADGYRGFSFKVHVTTKRQDAEMPG